MTTHRIVTPYVFVSMALVAGLAAALATIEPDRAWRAAIAALFLPTAWAIARLFGRAAFHRGDTKTTHRVLRVSIMGAALVLAVALAAEIGQTSGLIANSWDIDELVFGFALSVAMIIVGWASARSKG